MVLLCLTYKKLLIKKLSPDYDLNYKLSLPLIKKWFIILLSNAFHKNVFYKIFSLFYKLLLTFNTMIAKSEQSYFLTIFFIILPFSQLSAVIGKQSDTISNVSPPFRTIQQQNNNKQNISMISQCNFTHHKM